jgi:hypothetical protein
MTIINRQFTYKMKLEVQHKSLLTVPIADIQVEGTLDPDRDFASQIAEAHARHLERIRPTLEKARRKR